MYWSKLGTKIREYGYEFTTRKGVNKTINRHATGIVNALLNLFYGYAESKLTVEIAKSGLNTQISFTHEPTFNKSSLAYDLIEPLRSKIDSVVLKMLKHHEINNSDFYIAKHSYYMVRNPENMINNIASIDYKQPVKNLLAFLSD